MPENSKESIYEKLAEGLAATRMQLSVMLQQRFSNHININKEVLWSTTEENYPSPLKETDPASVAFSKHCLFAIHNLEEVIRKLNQLLNRNELNKALKIKDTYDILNIIYTEFRVHVQAMTDIASEANVPESILSAFHNVSESLSNLKNGNLTPTDINTISESLPKLEASLPSLLETYFTSQQTTVADKPENNYEVPKEYIYKYDPTAQERTEWFILLEPLRQAMQTGKNLNEVIIEIINKAEASGQPFSESEKALIEKTQEALEKSEIDKAGYYRYSRYETPLSKGIKAIYNFNWGINEVCRGFWEKNKIGASFQAKEHTIEALHHFWQIDFPAMGNNLQRISDQLFQAMLVHSKNIVLPQIEKLANVTHQIELQNHLRLGSLSDDIRPYFDTIEALYIGRGIPMANPFGYSRNQENAIKAKMISETEYEDIKRQGKEINSVSQLLKEYRDRGDFLNTMLKDSLTGGVASKGLMYTSLNPINYIPYASTISSLSSLIPYASHVTTPLYNTVQSAAQAIINGTIHYAEGTKRAFANFPKFEFLVKLAHCRKYNVLVDDEVKMLDNLENRLLGELTPEEKQLLIQNIKLRDNPDLNKHLLPDYNYRPLIIKLAMKKYDDRLLQENQSKQWFFNRAANDIQARVIKTAEAWPPEELVSVIQAIEKKNVLFSNKQHDYHTYREAETKNQAMRSEFLIRTLERDGLNSLLRATEVTLHHPKINLAQKRKLAVLFADINHEDRESYLHEAHQKASELLAKPSKIIHVIKTLYQQANSGSSDETLCHRLALELTLGGYATVKDWHDEPNILLATDETIRQNDLMAILNRLEAGQIFNIMQGIEKGEAAAIERGEILKGLLSPNKEHPKKPLTKPVLINLLVERYQKLAIAQPKDAHPDRELMNKIGLFLGRLAHQDKVFANLLFNQPHAKNVLVQECLNSPTTNTMKSDKALYYESLISSLPYESPKEDQTYSQFLEKIQPFIMEMYNAAKQTSNNNQAPSYTNAPIAMCDLIEKFTQTCVSPGSDAALKMHNIFSDLTQCAGKEGFAIRQMMLNTQLKSANSLNAKYMALLTKESSYLFWQKTKEDIISKENQQVIKENLQQIQENLQDLINLTPKGIKDDFNQIILKEIKSSVSAQNRHIKTVISKLGEFNEDLSLHCRFAQQEIIKSQSDLTEKSQLLAKAIVQHHVANLENDFMAEREKLIQHYTKLLESSPISVLNPKLELSIKQVMDNSIPRDSGLIELYAEKSNNIRSIDDVKNILAEMKQEAAAKKNHLLHQGEKIDLLMTIHHLNNETLFFMLANIEKTLNDYIHKRGNSSNVYQFFGKNLRKEKVNLVKEVLIKIKEISANLQTAKDTDFAQYANSLCQIVDNFHSKHDQLVKKHKGKPGDLGEKLENIIQVISPIKNGTQLITIAQNEQGLKPHK